MKEEIVDLVAEAIWAMPSAKRVTSFSSLPKSVQDLWREDARRVISKLEEADYKVIKFVKVEPKPFVFEEE